MHIHVDSQGLLPFAGKLEDEITRAQVDPSVVGVVSTVRIADASYLKYLPFRSHPLPDLAVLTNLHGHAALLLKITL